MVKENFKSSKKELIINYSDLLEAREMAEMNFNIVCDLLERKELSDAEYTFIITARRQFDESIKLMFLANKT